MPKTTPKPKKTKVKKSVKKNVNTNKNIINININKKSNASSSSQPKPQKQSYNPPNSTSIQISNPSTSHYPVDTYSNQRLLNEIQNQKLLNEIQSQKALIERNTNLINELKNNKNADTTPWIDFNNRLVDLENLSNYNSISYKPTSTIGSSTYGNKIYPENIGDDVSTLTEGNDYDASNEYSSFYPESNSLVSFGDENTSVYPESSISFGDDTTDIISSNSSSSISSKSSKNKSLASTKGSLADSVYEQVHLKPLGEIVNLADLIRNDEKNDEIINNLLNTEPQTHNESKLLTDLTEGNKDSSADNTIVIIPKKRGRPLGSKNKPKQQPIPNKKEGAINSIQSILENDNMIDEYSLLERERIHNAKKFNKPKSLF